ncbi:hypothetical protein D3C75_1012320 [compost metagenome]
MRPTLELVNTNDPALDFSSNGSSAWVSMKVAFTLTCITSFHMVIESSAIGAMSPNRPAFCNTPSRRGTLVAKSAARVWHCSGVVCNKSSVTICVGALEMAAISA